MKIISIIIVNHDGSRFLGRLFETIQEQTFQDFEIIFVDNGSADDSVEFVEKNYLKTKIIVSKNVGYGSGCNLGAQKASGKYLVFLNEDMYLPPDFLERMLTFRKNLLCQDKVGGISCKMVDFDRDPDGFPPMYGAKIDFMGFPVKNLEDSKTFVISGSPFFISNNLFKKAGGFNEMIFVYGEDVDLSWRLFLMGYKNFMVNETFIYHLGGAATGKLSAKKIADVIYGAFISIYTNFRMPTFIFILPFFIAFIFVFYLALTFIKIRTGYLCEIFKKFGLFIANVGKAREIRKFVKENRIKGDLAVLEYISFIPAFFLNNSLQKIGSNYDITNNIK